MECQDPDIRWESAIGPSEANSETAIHILLEAIKSSCFDVQFSAAFALGKLGFEIAIPILKQAIDLTDSPDDCNKMAIYALARIDSEESVLLLGQLMQNPDLSTLVIYILQHMNLEDIAPRLRRIICDARHEFENKITVWLNSEDILNL